MGQLGFDIGVTTLHSLTIRKLFYFVLFPSPIRIIFGHETSDLKIQSLIPRTTSLNMNSILCNIWNHPL